jgi:hypothetical protein
MFRSTIAIILLVSIMGLIDFNAFMADYQLPLNIVYTNDTKNLTLVSVEKFSADSNMYFNLIVEARDTNLYFKYSFPLWVRTIH